MMRTVLTLAVFLAVLTAQDKPAPRYVPIRQFDSSRDAARDIDEALAEARRSGKRVILDIGGDWCPWCRQMDEMFQTNPDLAKYRDERFIVVPVFYDADHKNPEVLSRYSKVLGIPHYFVLDNTGAEIHSQHLTELQAEGRYDPVKFQKFFERWAPRN